MRRSLKTLGFSWRADLAVKSVQSGVAHGQVDLTAWAGVTCMPCKPRSAVLLTTLSRYTMSRLGDHAELTYSACKNRHPCLPPELEQVVLCRVYGSQCIFLQW